MITCLSAWKFHKGYAANPKNEYLYNKKELQEDSQLYDYGARFYDPVVGRWTAIDPNAENYENTSSYAYVLNNPINFSDMDGRDTIHLHEVVILGQSRPNRPDHLDPTSLETWVPGLAEYRDYKYAKSKGYSGSFSDYLHLGHGTGNPVMGYPEIGLGGTNTVYKGVKDGLPYIGKAFDILKRYSKAEALLLKIEPVLNDIGDAKLLRAIEQKVIEYKKSLGEVANIRNAFDPKAVDYEEYGAKAEKWLSDNASNWKELFK